MEVANCADFLRALTILFASFWLFNMEYPKIYHTLMEFIQKQILGLNDSLKMGKQIATFLNKLHRVDAGK